MKRTIETVALFLVLSAAAVSCQKENTNSITLAEVITDNQAVYTYQYEVNGIRSRITLRGETERTDFINSLLALAERGSSVSFFEETRFTQSMSKETVTFSTQNKEEAMNWLIEMSNNGYEVSFNYDKKTGTYNCSATK